MQSSPYGDFSVIFFFFSASQTEDSPKFNKLEGSVAHRWGKVGVWGGGGVVSR